MEKVAVLFSQKDGRNCFSQNLRLYCPHNNAFVLSPRLFSSVSKEESEGGTNEELGTGILVGQLGLLVIEVRISSGW